MQLGKFATWEIVSETIAIKKTSMSFFKDDAMVIPIQVRQFWDIEDMKYGDDNISATLIFEGKEYSATIRVAKAHSSTLIGWRKDLASELSRFHSEEHHYPFMLFEKLGGQRYSLTVKEDVNENFNDIRYQLYDDFLKEFPLEKLTSMTLEKYTNLNRNDSFCYWLETKTISLGSMKGGGSAKFGIYQYANPTSDSKLMMDNKYAWYKKYNVSDCGSAYNIVLSTINDIAQAASNGEFDLIDNIKTLGEVYKWKIAFLYSDMSIMPIYERGMLENICLLLGYKNAKKKPNSELQKYLMSQQNGRDFYSYYDYLLSLLPKEAAYWLYAPGESASKWDEFYEEGVMGLGWSKLGNYENYETDEELVSAIEKEYGGRGSHKNDKCAIREFQYEIKEGDIIIVKQGTSKLLGRGVVQSECYYDDSREEYGNRRKVTWTHKGVWDVDVTLPQKTLTSISRSKAKIYDDIIGVNEQPPIQIEDSTLRDDSLKLEVYTDEHFLNEAFLDGEVLVSIKQLLRRKKNILLQGAPGVGKTFIAKRLAYTMMGVKDSSRVELVQFHQNYSYEDFIMGYKPKGDSFELHMGIFYRFCKKAQENPNNDYFFIIDEINRGNLSKIFGELLMLIEKDYRGESLTLAYSGEQFNVPSNLYIIGMMNTADRSLAMIDYALRRRFSFVEMSPCFETSKFKEYMEGLGNGKFKTLISAIIKLNADIRQDASLGKGFEIGHSYFCNLTKETCSDEVLAEIVKYDIVPTIQEYWFDDDQKADAKAKELYGIL